MKVFTGEGFRKREDIQIQTAAMRLLIKIQFANGTVFSGTNATLRLRSISTSTGAKTIIDKTPLETLFELAAAKEGFFILDTNEDDQPWGATGFVDLSDQGAIALSADAYFSADIECPGYTIVKCEISAMTAPVTTKKYTRYNPLTIQGTVKDIPLAGIKHLAVRPQDIDNLQLQYAGFPQDLPKEELFAMGMMLNDLVSVSTAGKVVYGVSNWLLLDVDSCQRAVVEPSDGAGSDGQIKVYLLSEETLV